MGINIENIYYVYIYLNPLKEGKFIYDNLKFDYEPFYIGMGKGNRYKQHLYYFKRNRSHKNNIISKIVNSGRLPIIIKIEDNLLLETAVDLEIKLIKLVGRYDLEEGTLTNRTDGGDSTGYKHSKSSIEKMKRYQQENHYFKGRKRDDHSKFMKENNPMFDSGVKENHRLVCNSSDRVSKLSIQNSGINNPFYNKKHSEETKEKLKKSFSKEINQIDMETLKIIQRFESIKKAYSFFGNKISYISQCCRGISLSSGGYYWEYNNDDLRNRYRELVDNKRKISRKIRRVHQFDLNNILLDIYDNAKMASICSGDNYNSILRCCKNKQVSTKRYYWRYVN